LPNPAHILTDILSRLARTRARVHSIEVRAGTILFATLLVLALVSASLLEVGFRLESSGRTILFIVVAAIVGACFVWFVGRPMLRALGILKSSDDFELASKVGSAFPAIHDRLINLLQLHKEIETGKSFYSPELVDASFQDLATNIQGINFLTSVDSSPVVRSTKLFAVSVFGAVLLVFTSPGQFADALSRVLHFRTR
jgi:hypothetical protein